MENIEASTKSQINTNDQNSKPQTKSFWSLNIGIWNYVKNKMIKNLPLFVIPAKAGIYAFGIILDSRLRGNDNSEVWCKSIFIVRGWPIGHD
jgi:hypothetical protein